MKLIFCLECNDVISLRSGEDRVCSCGKSGGKYINHVKAEYWGPCVPLGFANSSFIEAVRNQPEKDWGKDFKAFVIQKQCETFIKKM